jgi:N-acetyl-gamma-glutamylphosphate reductase
MGSSRVLGHVIIICVQFMATMQTAFLVSGGCLKDGTIRCTNTVSGSAGSGEALRTLNNYKLLTNSVTATLKPYATSSHHNQRAKHDAGDKLILQRRCRLGVFHFISRQFVPIG